MNEDFTIRLKKYTGKDLLVILIYAIVFTFVFFLMFLGILRIFEVNDYFGAEQYQYVKTYCEPSGFFGWGYDCDTIQYNKDIGNIPNDYQEFPTFDFNGSGLRYTTS